jgi:ADP-ribose diphosphatase
VDERVVSSRRIYEGRVVNLRVDSVELPSGRKAEREVVKHGDAVTILPVDEDGKLVLVRQFRLPARSVLLEAPAGNMDDGETPEQTARRELREETGYDCHHLEPLVKFYPAPGFSEEFMHCFVASGLFESAPDADEDEELEATRLDLDEVIQMIHAGEIIDAKTIAAVLSYALQR